MDKEFCTWQEMGVRTNTALATATPQELEPLATKAMSNTLKQAGCLYIEPLVIDGTTMTMKGYRPLTDMPGQFRWIRCVQCHHHWAVTRDYSNYDEGYCPYCWVEMQQKAAA